MTTISSLTVLRAQQRHSGGPAPKARLGVQMRASSRIRIPRIATMGVPGTCCRDYGDHSRPGGHRQDFHTIIPRRIQAAGSLWPRVWILQKPARPANLVGRHFFTSRRLSQRDRNRATEDVRSLPSVIAQVHKQLSFWCAGSHARRCSGPAGRRRRPPQCVSGFVMRAAAVECGYPSRKARAAHRRRYFLSLHSPGGGFGLSAHHIGDPRG